MTSGIPREGSLVLYRQQPARIQRAGEKLTLELPDGESARVRVKDVALLHPGPLGALADLRALEGEIEAAWEILAGTTTTLPELAELAYGAYTPVTAWAAWQWVAEGLYFRGAPDSIQAITPAQVAQTRAARAAEETERRAWNDFLARARAGVVAPTDLRYVREVEAAALGQGANHRALRALGREETPEAAHQLLLDLGIWDETVNPHPQRLRVELASPALTVVSHWPPVELAQFDAERADLTSLVAYAIDEAFTETPDDAVGFGAAPGVLGDEPYFWVHVADAAAAIFPDSPLDLEARGRAATLHLPERIVTMLPPEATPLLGLGLSDVSRALSFALRLDGSAQPEVMAVVPSWVRVQRLSYRDADAYLSGAPLQQLHVAAIAYEQRRIRQGRINIELPEVSIRVEDGSIKIRPTEQTASRTVVENLMIMAGEALARMAQVRGIPMPFATQDSPEGAPPPANPTGLAAMYALRRTMKRSQHRITPAPHAGLGLEAYLQATSPMRRYLDLVAHQQLRAYLAQSSDTPSRAVYPRLLSGAEIAERIGATDAIIGDLRTAESLSNRHWTLVMLRREPGWRGSGQVVEIRGQSATLILPELALETPVHPDRLPALDTVLPVVLRSLDLPRLDARFRVVRHETQP